MEPRNKSNVAVPLIKTRVIGAHAFDLLVRVARESPGYKVGTCFYFYYFSIFLVTFRLSGK